MDHTVQYMLSWNVTDRVQRGHAPDLLCINYLHPAGKVAHIPTVSIITAPESSPAMPEIERFLLAFFSHPPR